MRRIAIVEWGEPLGTLEAPTPEPSGGEVLVRVEVCGVCHSDVHLWDGYFDLGGGERINISERFSLPFSPGHEIVGTVAALGPEAEGVEVGRSYVVYPWIGCGTCDRCTEGRELLCATPRCLGTRREGGYADHVIVPDARYLVPYDGIPRELACTYACSGVTSYSALRKIGRLGADDWLAVIGAGGVGSSGIQLARPVTGARVIAADIDPAKRDWAKEAGAEIVVDNGAEGAVDDVLAKTGGGVAAAIDFVGAPQTVRFGVDILRRGGHLVVVGLFGGAATLQTVPLIQKQITIEGSYVGTLDDLKKVIALAQAGTLPPIPVTTVPAERASEALSDLKSGGKVLGRVVLVHD